MAFKVRDIDGNDVTEEKDWFINSDGLLFYFSDDELVQTDDYWIEML